MTESAAVTGAMGQPWSGQRGWHVANWGPLGWAETAVKLVAIVVGVGAALSDGAASIPDTHRLSYWLLFAVAVGYLGTIGDRLIDRELIAIGFVVLMVIGHWALVYAMGRPAWPSGPVRAFAGLMLVGDLIKVGYFASTRASVRGIRWTVPLAMTSVLALVYLVALVTA